MNMYNAYGRVYIISIIIMSLLPCQAEQTFILFFMKSWDACISINNTTIRIIYEAPYFYVT